MPFYRLKKPHKIDQEKKEVQIMNDGIEYAKLIGVPSCSCEYVRRKKKPGLFKKKTLIKKVNDELDARAHAAETTEPAACSECGGECSGECTGDCLEKKESKAVYSTDLAEEKDCRAEKREKRLGMIVTAQIVTAFVLVAAILLTNIIWENSGMNLLLKSVFGDGSVTEKIQDERVYSDFSLNLPVKSEGVTLVKGVISVDGEYSIYPVCEGKIDKVEKAENGTYSITVKHSDSFSSVIEGADMVYFAAGDVVNKNVPVCHTSGKANVYLYDNGTLLTDYAAVENSIVFNK